MSTAFPSSSLRLLHLEDSIADAELIHHALGLEWPDSEFTRVETSRDFSAALARNSFDVILSDFSLPGFNGLNALKIAREISPGTPFIFLSGTIGEENAVDALKQGATDYVIKDRMARLVPAIHRALSSMREQRARRRAEQLLGESQEQFQQLAEQSSEVFWFVSLNPERVVFTSPAVEKIWGRKPADFYADPRLRLAAIHPDDRARARQAYEDCISGKAPRLEEEYRVIRPDGITHWVLDSATVTHDPAGKPVRLNGIVKDITARKLDEEKLREQAELLDKARDAIVVTDLEHRVIFWNNGAARVFGWTAAEAMGRPLSELFGAEAAHKIGAGAAPKTDEWNGEVELPDRQGKRRVLQYSITLIRDREGNLKSRLIISTDITEQKELENQFLRAQRLEGLGLLAAGIAHDLNNVLTPALMGVPLLRHQMNSPREVRILEAIERSAERGAGLVRQILSFAHGASGEKTLVQVKHLLHDIAELVQQTFPKSIRLEKDVPGDLWPVHGNPTQIHQVLLNLCVNARDAMPEGGKLQLHACNRLLDETEAEALPEAHSGPYLVLKVADEGTGIPPEILPRIWDPFFTTKGEHKGTGLGLATVRGIVANHGGFITLESTPQHGTTFQVFMPAQSPETTVADLSRTVPPFSFRGKGELVLVVEDEFAVNSLIKTILTKHGYRVLAAAEGAEAMALFTARAAEFSLVITDVDMPGLNGVGLAHAIRRYNEAVKIIFMSGAGSSNIPPALAASCGVIQKPFTGDALLAQVRTTLEPTQTGK